jgi:hypothetical protein
MRRLVVIVLLALSASGLACNQGEPTVQAGGVPARTVTEMPAGAHASAGFSSPYFCSRR